MAYVFELLNHKSEIAIVQPEQPICDKYPKYICDQKIETIAGSYIISNRESIIYIMDFHSRTFFKHSIPELLNERHVTFHALSDSSFAFSINTFNNNSSRCVYMYDIPAKLYTLVHDKRLDLLIPRNSKFIVLHERSPVYTVISKKGVTNHVVTKHVVTTCDSKKQLQYLRDYSYGMGGYLVRNGDEYTIYDYTDQSVKWKYNRKYSDANVTILDNTVIDTRCMKIDVINRNGNVSSINEKYTSILHKKDLFIVRLESGGSLIVLNGKIYKCGKIVEVYFGGEYICIYNGEFTEVRYPDTFELINYIAGKCIQHRINRSAADLEGIAKIFIPKLPLPVGRIVASFM